MDDHCNPFQVTQQTHTITTAATKRSEGDKEAVEDKEGCNSVVANTDPGDQCPRFGLGVAASLL